MGNTEKRKKGRREVTGIAWPLFVSGAIFGAFSFRLGERFGVDMFGWVPFIEDPVPVAGWMTLIFGVGLMVFAITGGWFGEHLKDDEE